MNGGRDPAFSSLDLSSGLGVRVGCGSVVAFEGDCGLRV